MRIGAIAACGLLLAAAPASAQVGPDQTRVDLYDKDSRRTGHVIVDEKTGRLDTYDASSKRTGYGVIQPDGRVDRYRLDGSRDGSATATNPRGGRK